MDVVFLWCKKHKKLISNKTVSKLKKKVSGIGHFEKQPIKIFTKEAGWLGRVIARLPLMMPQVTEV